MEIPALTRDIEAARTVPDEITIKDPASVRHKIEGIRLGKKEQLAIISGITPFLVFRFRRDINKKEYCA